MIESSHDSPKNFTRVKASIDSSQFMKSLESIHEFSYIYARPDILGDWFFNFTLRYEMQTSAIKIFQSGTQIKRKCAELIINWQNLYVFETFLAFYLYI